MVVVDGKPNAIRYTFQVESMNFHAAGRAASKVKQVLLGSGYDLPRH